MPLQIFPAGAALAIKQVDFVIIAIVSPIHALGDGQAHGERGYVPLWQMAWRHQDLDAEDVLRQISLADEFPDPEIRDGVERAKFRLPMLDRRKQSEIAEPDQLMNDVGMTIAGVGIGYGTESLRKPAASDLPSYRPNDAEMALDQRAAKRQLFGVKSVEVMPAKRVR